MSSDNKNEKILIKGTIIYAIGNFGTKILAFLIVPLYTYYISTSDMGDYDLITTTVSLLTPIITLRISDAAYRWLLQKVGSEKNCISATYRIVFLGTIISALVLLVINYFIPIRFCGYFIALLVLGRWVESLQTLLRGLKRQGLFALSGIIQSVTYLILNVILIVAFKQGVYGMFRGYITSLILTIILIICAEPKLRSGIICSEENRQLTKDMLKYSAPIVPSGLSWWVMSASDRYVIRFILGSSANGIYAVANKFPTILSMIFTIFNYSWTDLALGNLNEGEETSNYSSKLFQELYKLTFTFTIFLIPATKIVTRLILSDSYKVSSIYISFLYLGAIFQGFTTFSSAGLLQKTKTGVITRSSLIGATVNLAIDLAFMRYIGIQAASISTFCGFFVMWLCRMHDIRNVSPIKINKWMFTSLFTITIVIAIATIWTCNIIDLILSIAGLFIFVIINRNYITSFFRKIKSRIIKR